MAYAIIQNGIVTNSVEAADAFAKAQGWVLLPAGAGIGWIYDGKTFTAPASVPLVPTNADVDAEHDRRVLTGRAFAVEAVGPVPLEGSEKTQLVLLALKDTARDLKEAGITASVLVFTDRDSTDRHLTAGQMIGLVNAGKAWVQAVHEAKRALKAMAPIPADYADDRHWPPMA